MHTPISLFSQQIVGAGLYIELWLNNTYKVILFYEVHLWSKQRYHHPCRMRTFFDGHKITHSCMIFVHPPKSHAICFCTLSESLPWLPFSLEKKNKRKSERYIDWIFQWLSVYRDLYSFSSSWLAAGNSQKPSSVLETGCHPDQTTMQPHIFDDVLTLCSKNGKK